MGAFDAKTIGQVRDSLNWNFILTDILKKPQAHNISTVILSSLRSQMSKIKDMIFDFKNILSWPTTIMTKPQYRINQMKLKCAVGRFLLNIYLALVGLYTAPSGLDAWFCLFTNCSCFKMKMFSFHLVSFSLCFSLLRCTFMFMLFNALV